MIVFLTTLDSIMPLAEEVASCEKWPLHCKLLVARSVLGFDLNNLLTQSILTSVA